LRSELKVKTVFNFSPTSILSTINFSSIFSISLQVVKRFNVEKNDFPKELPMCRGTPTFVVYKNGVPTKWDEFKPNDFAKKLAAWMHTGIGMTVRGVINDNYSREIHINIDACIDPI
jgi:hypothetical protein